VQRREQVLEEKRMVTAVSSLCTKVCICLVLGRQGCKEKGAADAMAVSEDRRQIKATAEVKM
jgi:hypothetical protein